jgi:hypothetical protein
MSILALPAQNEQLYAQVPLQRRAALKGGYFAKTL